MESPIKLAKNCLWSNLIKEEEEETQYMYAFMQVYTFTQTAFKWRLCIRLV